MDRCYRVQTYQIYQNFSRTVHFTKVVIVKIIVLGIARMSPITFRIYGRIYRMLGIHSTFGRRLSMINFLF